MSNQAAYLNAAHARLEVGPAEVYTPSADNLLIKVESIALYPLEAKMQRWAIFPLPYPAIIGFGFAGTVEKVGDNVTKFKAGDRVVALRSVSTFGDSKFGAYQKYALADPVTTVKLDDKTSFDEANAAGNLSTVAGLAAVAGLERPGHASEKSKGKKILVYGGSSSLGSLTVQWAAQAGYTVITTSSPRNKEYVSSLGAVHIIDHTQDPETVVKELKEQGPYNYVWNPIGTPPTDDIMVKLLTETGGVFYTVNVYTSAELPKGVQAKGYSYPQELEKPEYKELSNWFYGEYYGKALADGSIKAGRIEKVKGGLSAIQTGLDKLLGPEVSGVKLVVDPWE